KRAGQSPRWSSYDRRQAGHPRSARPAEFQLTMKSRIIFINRAPVLARWGAVVAQRHGFEEAEALSLARALAGRGPSSYRARPGRFCATERPRVSTRGQGLIGCRPPPGEPRSREFLGQGTL